MNRLILLTLVIVALVSLNFVLLQQLEQARAQTNSTSTNGTITNNTANSTSTNGTITNNTANSTSTNGTITITNNTYTNADYNLTMSYPLNWTLNTTSGNILMNAVGNTSSPQNDQAVQALHFLAYFYPNTAGTGNNTVAPTVVNLAVVDNVGGFKSPKDYVDSILHEQLANNPRFQYENSSTTIGNHTAEKLVYDDKDNKNRAIKTVNTVTMNGDKIILFGYSSSPRDNEKYLPVAEDMMKSLIIR